MSTPTAAARKADLRQLAAHPEIRRVMRPLSDDELARLERNVLRDGIREPLAVWTHDGAHYVLDGHHRLEIARKHGLPAPVREIDNLRTLEDALAWAIANQLGRRNLSDNERADLIGREYLVAQKRQGARTDRTCGQSDHKLPPRDRKTRAAVAKKHRVSPETVQRAARFSQALDVLAQAVGDEDAVRQAVLAANSRFSQKDVGLLAGLAASDPDLARAAFAAVLDGREKNAQRAVGAVRRERQRRESADRGTAAVLPPSAQLIHGDFRTACASIADASVDLILTDPPYDRESLALWQALSETAGRVLKPGGYLAAYTGQYVLPDVIDALRRHLTYYWTFCLPYETRQNHLRLWEKRLWNAWKPVLVFSRGRGGDHEWTPDLIRIPASEKGEAKNLHDWGQPALEARILVEAFCPAGGTVLDPMCGSGTVLLAASTAERRAIGIEIDRNHYLSARARIADALRSR